MDFEEAINDLKMKYNGETVIDLEDEVPDDVIDLCKKSIAGKLITDNTVNQPAFKETIIKM